MKRLTKEYQIWSHLADMYESRTSSGKGICTALNRLWTIGRISGSERRDCVARLRRRFEPRWWEPLRKRYLPYFWKPGDAEPRAAACDELFYESFDEEMDVSRRLHTLPPMPVPDELFCGVGGLL